ncbi:MAG: flippase [Methanosarcinales archaeon]|nr:MAG: flippase [Methanosarcinales archaeon]
MNTMQRIVKNMAALFTAHFIVAMVSLVLSIFIARVLGATIFGTYTFVLAFIAVFAVFSDMGYNTLLVREVARDKSQAGKYLNNVLSIRLALSLTILGLIAIIINVLGYPEDIKNIIYIFGIYTLVISFSDVFKVTFRAFEKMKYESYITILSNVVKVSLGLLILFLGYGLLEISLVFLLSGIFDLLISFLVCEKRFVKPRMELDTDFWKSTITSALPLGLLTMLGLICVKIDTLMLAMMKGVVVVGWYNAAYNLVLGFRPIPHIFMNALFPLMAHYYVSSEKSLRIGYERSFKYLFVLGLPIAAGISLLSGEIIFLIYGEQFSHSVVALRILAWDVLLLSICAPVSFMLVFMDRQNQMAIIVGVCALLNIVLNLALIPRFSYVGAGIATLTTESVLFVLYFYFVSKYSHKLPIYKIIVRPLVSCSVMVLCIHYCGELWLPARIASATILYFAVLYLIGGFDEKDKEMVGALISG